MSDPIFSKQDIDDAANDVAAFIDQKLVLHYDVFEGDEDHFTAAIAKRLIEMYNAGESLY